MEGLDVGVSQLDSLLQFFRHQLLCFSDLVFGHFERREVYMVEFQFIAFYCFVASLLDICQDGGNGLV